MTMTIRPVSTIEFIGLSETNTIGSYRCYEGNVTDVVALGASLQEMVGQFLPQTVSPRLTLVLDKGTVSRDNFNSMIKFFALDRLLPWVVAVSTDPARDSALPHPS